MVATTVQSAEIIDLLLSFGADPSIKNNRGHTALDIAVARYHNIDSFDLIDVSMVSDFLHSQNDLARIYSKFSDGYISDLLKPKSDPSTITGDTQFLGAAKEKKRFQDASRNEQINEEINMETDVLDTKVNAPADNIFLSIIKSQAEFIGFVPFNIRLDGSDAPAILILAILFILIDLALVYIIFTGIFSAVSHKSDTSETASEISHMHSPEKTTRKAKKTS
jgi:hypothetical protein